MKQKKEISWILFSITIPLLIGGLINQEKGEFIPFGIILIIYVLFDALMISFAFLLKDFSNKAYFYFTCMVIAIFSLVVGKLLFQII